MDCRKAVVLGLLGVVAGCQHLGGSSGAGTTTPVTVSAKPEVVDPALVKKEVPLPPIKPPPAACVAYGDFMAAEARVPGVPTWKKEEMQETARKAYRQGIALDPKDLAAYRGLARLYQQMDDQAHAVATYRQALAVAPKDAPLWYELGIAHTVKKEWAPGLECLTRAVELDPENRRYVHMLGCTLACCGRFDESVACCARVDGEAKAHYNVARVLKRLQQPELARQHLQLALQQDANLPAAQEMLNELNGHPAPVRPVSYDEQKPAPVGDDALPPPSLPQVAPPQVSLSPAELPAPLQLPKPPAGR